MSQLSLRQESKINEAIRAGISEERTAELVGCTVKQVRKTMEVYDRIYADQKEWETTLEREKPK